MNKLRLLSVVCTAIYIYSNAVMAATFTPLGTLAGDDLSRATGVSADGSVVVGISIDTTYLDPYNLGEAYRWTRDGGMVGLGKVPNYDDLSAAEGVSDDGSVVVGYSACCNGVLYQAFRWTSEGGMVGLGNLPDSHAYDVSADGSVVVGDSDAGEFQGEATLWTSDGSRVGLGYLTGFATVSVARGVSDDGSVVVGFSSSFPDYEAFRWTSEDGMVGLGHLPGGDDNVAYDVSADGSVVVGRSHSASGYEAFRWTSEDGMVGLGHLPGGSSSQALGVSADGSVIVGTGNSASSPPDEAFRWTSEDGMQSVGLILTTAGVDLTGWTLKRATGVSADGNTIVGWATNPDGDTEAWIAVLSDTPLPTTPVDLSGTIKASNDADICAMVLASGQYIFSCNPIGNFSLINLPREQNGTVKRQIYADGFFPKIDILMDSSTDDVVMTRSGTCPSYSAPYDPAVAPGSAGERINISGKVLLQNSQTPICAMVLANGQHMFSCDGTGNYALNIPLDTNGQFKLQVYADGFAPTIQTFDEFQAMNDVRMARAAECQ